MKQKHVRFSLQGMAKMDELNTGKQRLFELEMKGETMTEQ